METPAGKATAEHPKTLLTLKWVRVRGASLFLL